MPDTVFFRRNIGQAAGLKVHLFGFGKHPAWNEHQQKLGETSEKLLFLRDQLYWNGILKHMSAWETLAPDSRCEFDHWLVWEQPGTVVLARIVASADASGRKFPFIVAAELRGCAFDLVWRRAAAALGEFVQRCQGLPNHMAVEAAFGSEQGALESLLASEAPVAERLGPSLAERVEFASLPDWDTQGVALARLLYKVESSWAVFAPVRDGKAPRSQSGVALRVPALPGKVTASVQLWEEFVNALVHKDIPRLYMVPATGDWLDLVVGEFNAGHFLGLLANRKHLGLETEVPHAADPDLQAQAQALMAAWRAGTPLPVPSRPIPGSNPTETTTHFFRRSETNSSPKPEPPPSTTQGQPTPAKAGVTRKLFWALCVAAALACAWWLWHASRSAPAHSTAAPGTPPSPQPATASEFVEPKELPMLEEGGKEQAIELPLKGQPDRASLAALKLEATAEPAGRLGVRAIFFEGRWHLGLKPLSAGAATVQVKATDERGLVSKPMAFGVTVAPQPALPILTGVAAQNLELGQAAVSISLQMTLDARLKAEAVQVSAKAEDPSVVGVSAKADGSTWHLGLVPKASGRTLVHVTATDERGRNSNPIEFQVTVEASPPVPVVARVEDQTLETGQLPTTLPLALEVDGRLHLDKLQLLAKPADTAVVDALASVSAGKGQLTLTPKAVGKSLVSVTATDERGRSSLSMTFAVNVNPRFTAPVLGAVTAQILEQGQAPTNIWLDLRVDGRLQPERALVKAISDRSDVVKADASLIQGRWQLSLAPQASGKALVSVAATDQRGLASQAVSFDVIVNSPGLKAVDLAAMSNAPPQSPTQQERDQLNWQLEAFRVWFELGRKSDSPIKNPPKFPGEGEPAKPLEGGLSIPLRKFYREKASDLQAKFKAATLLTPELERTFKRLSDKIDGWP